MRPTLTTNTIFGTPGRIDVLRVLWGVSVPLTAAEVTRRTRMTHPAVSTILRSLAHQGLIGSSPAGRGHTYWILRDNVYVENVVDPVFRAEREVPEFMIATLRTELETLTKSVVMFGSYARGDQSVESDVDVVIVAEDEPAVNVVRGTLESFSLTFERRFGATLSPLVYSRLEAAELAERAPSLWQSIWNDGATVCGLSVDEWTTHE